MNSWDNSTNSNAITCTVFILKKMWLKSLAIRTNEHCCPQISRCLTTSSVLQKAVAGKWYNRPYRYKKGRPQIFTYDMLRRPHHLGVSKTWMTLNTQNLEEFKQQQAITVAQDEVIRRFIRAILYEHLPHTLGGIELVIKRRGNVVYVAGFLTPGGNTEIHKVYWLWGFTEEILSNLLKQPVKLELQFVRQEADLARGYWIPPQTA